MRLHVPEMIKVKAKGSGVDKWVWPIKSSTISLEKLTFERHKVINTDRFSNNTRYSGQWNGILSTIQSFILFQRKTGHLIHFQKRFAPKDSFHFTIQMHMKKMVILFLMSLHRGNRKTKVSATLSSSEVDRKSTGTRPEMEFSDYTVERLRSKGLMTDWLKENRETNMACRFIFPENVQGKPKNQNLNEFGEATAVLRDDGIVWMEVSHEIHPDWKSTEFIPYF